MSIPFWFNEPSILLNKEHAFSIFPNSDMEYGEKLNATTRLVIILTIVGYFITSSVNLLITSIVTIVGIIIIFINNPKNTIENKRARLLNDIGTEGFTGKESYETLKSNFTMPTIENPLQNLEPTANVNGKKPAAPSFNQKVTNQINEKAKAQIEALNKDFPDMNKNLFKDLGEEVNFENAMRPFYTMPNTRTPNDQKSFTDFCYGDMESSKDTHLESNF